mmetsp:Transcript_25651/g.73232  ORF Transcript_25651/g.73232 Transcript_25651/m.73232 type:complete len:344 (-) Transcript_25651:453-1484(-)
MGNFCHLPRLWFGGRAFFLRDLLRVQAPHISPGDLPRPQLCHRLAAYGRLVHLGPHRQHERHQRSLDVDLQDIPWLLLGPRPLRDLQKLLRREYGRADWRQGLRHQLAGHGRRRQGYRLLVHGRAILLRLVLVHRLLCQLSLGTLREHIRSAGRRGACDGGRGPGRLGGDRARGERRLGHRRRAGAEAEEGLPGARRISQDRGPQLVLRPPEGRVLRLPRHERRRQDHDPPDAHRRGAAVERHGQHRRARHRERAVGGAAALGLLPAARCASGPAHRPRAPRALRPHQAHPEDGAPRLLRRHDARPVLGPSRRQDGDDPERRQQAQALARHCPDGCPTIGAVG